MKILIFTNIFIQLLHSVKTYTPKHKINKTTGHKNNFHHSNICGSALKKKLSVISENGYGTQQEF